MRVIRRRAYARAGLIGNPSDGYNGRTVSVIVRDFLAEVIMYPWDEVEVLGSRDDQTRFRSVRDLTHDVRLHGYYGGVRLLQATIKRFVEFAEQNNLKLHDQNFSIRYQTSIPRQVGLAGSSAIIVATLRALCEFYNLEIPREILPSLALSVETRELGIAGGLQDRVIQVYEGLVSMDFSHDRMTERMGCRCGQYESLDLSLLPPLYLAYSEEFGEPTEVLHNDLRGRFDRGETAVVSAMQGFAELAQRGRQALLDRNYKLFGELLDRNFDLRRSICQLHSQHVEMVEAARSVGCSAKFAGSGGAII